jgi:hypothetical protein
MANQVAAERGEQLPFPEEFKSVTAIGKTAAAAETTEDRNAKPEEAQPSTQPVEASKGPVVAHSALSSPEAVQEAMDRFQPTKAEQQGTETEPVDAREQDQRNTEILRQAEFGVILERAYIEATALDPRLEAVEIAALPEDVPSVARVLPAWRSESGKHRVEIALGNVDEKLKETEKLIAAIPGGRKLFAEKMGITEDKLTPELMLVFGFLHELGHVTEFMDHEANPKELEVRMKREKEALPIGRATVSAMMTEGSVAHKFIDENWDEISSRLGVRSVGDLLEKQHVAYRSMSSEAHADDFADLILRMNPTMIDQMIGPYKEEYRRYAVAA